MGSPVSQRHASRGEGEGLNAMDEVFNERIPDVQIINATVAGGGSRCHRWPSARVHVTVSPGRHAPSRSVYDKARCVGAGWVSVRIRPLAFVASRRWS